LVDLGIAREQRLSAKQLRQDAAGGPHVNRGRVLRVAEKQLQNMDGKWLQSRRSGEVNAHGHSTGIAITPTSGARYHKVTTSWVYNFLAWKALANPDRRFDNAYVKENDDDATRSMTHQNLPA
jgi:hypothetical protein